MNDLAKPTVNKDDCCAIKKQEVPIIREQLGIIISRINETIYNLSDITNRLDMFLPIDDKDNANIAINTIDIDVNESNITAILETISDTNRIISIRTRLLLNHLLKLV